MIFYNKYNFLQTLIIFLSVINLHTYCITHGFNFGVEAGAEEARYLNIPALGRISNLGFFYDVTKDLFHDVFVFKAPISNESIVTTSKATLKSEASLANTYKQKFELLNIDSNTAANILSNLIRVEGSFEFLNSEREEEEDTEEEEKVNGIILLKCQTVKENLHVFYEGLKNSYNSEIIEQSKATHVVTGITWGAQIILNIKLLKNEAQGQSQCKNLNNAQANRIMISELKRLIGRVTNSKFKIETNNSATFSTTIYGDISLPLEIQTQFQNQAPKTYQEVLELLNKIPKLLTDINGGKGIPFEYTLTPISVFKDFLKLNFTPVASYKLNEWILKDFVEIFDDLLTTERKLSNLKTLLESYPDCLLPETFAKLVNLTSSFSKNKLNFTLNFQDILVKVRSGLLPQSGLSDLAEEYLNNNEFCSQTLDTKLAEEFKDALEKIKLYEFFQNANKYGNIKYIGGEKQIETHALTYRTNLNLEMLNFPVIYILFYRIEFMTNDVQLWNANLHTFLKLLNKKYNRLFIVDCDFEFQECAKINGTDIKQFVSGKPIIHDLQLELISMEDKLKPLLHIKSLGLKAHVGNLYDARYDGFTSQSILSQQSKLKTTEKNNPIQVTSKVSSFTSDIFSESSINKFKALEVDTEQQFSILAGIFPGINSKLYLKNTLRNLNRKFVRSFVHTKYLHEEEIEINENLPINEEFLNNVDSKATHFVKKIQFGFTTIFAVEYQGFLINNSVNNNIENMDLFNENERMKRKTPIFLGESLTEFETELQAYVESLKEIVERLGSDIETLNTTAIVILLEDLNTKRILLEKAGKFEIKIYSNIKEGIREPLILKSSNDLTDFLTGEFAPMLNSAEGQPIDIVLYPLENLKPALGIFSPCIVSYETLSTIQNPTEYANIIDQIDKVEQEIFILESNVKDNLNLATQKDFNALRSIKEEFKNTLGRFKERFGKIVRKIKEGTLELNSSFLQNLKEEFLNKDYYITADGRYKEFEKMSFFMEKLKLYKWLNRRNKQEQNNTVKVTYLGRESEVESFNQIFAEGKGEFLWLYLLYFKPSWTNDNLSTEGGESWRRCIQIFFGPLSSFEVNDNRWKLYIIDCDFNHPYCDNMTHSAIHEYKNGKLITTDYIEAIEEEEVDWKKLFHDVQNSVQENTNNIRSIRRGKSLSSEFWTKILSVDAVTLGCGEIVSLPPKGGSIWLDYKSNQAYRNNERCLWTFNNTSNGKLNGVKVKITLLCEGFGDAGDVLSVVQWTPWDSRPLSSQQLKSNGEDYSSKMWVYGLYLSFTSNGFSTGKGFMIRLDVVAIYSNRNAALIFSESMSPGMGSYGPYENGSIVSIAINPQKAMQSSAAAVASTSSSSSTLTSTALTLTVNYLDSKTMGSCDHLDSLDVYEIGRGGEPNRLARLCGNLTIPISYTTEYSVIALFFTDKSTAGKGFQLSWQ